jgi:hypothetical protein
MGYFAITSNQPLEVAKTSEAIFINNSATYTFYEMEVVSTVNADVFTAYFANGLAVSKMYLSNFTDSFHVQHLLKSPLSLTESREYGEGC